MWAILLFVVVGLSQGVLAVDDRFVEGYARALLDREYRLTGMTLEVRNGVLILRARDFGGTRTSELVEALEAIPGVVKVDVEVEKSPGVRTETTHQDRDPTAAPSPWLPSGLLFEPLHADPRWPRFSLSYRRFLDGSVLRNGASANVGGTIPVYRSQYKRGGQWEVGVQAGTFSLFDLSAQSGSNDILNTDFTLALFYGYRQGQFSALFRLAHQSSHLGDEFLQNTGTSRIEVNYDRLDLKLSYELLEWLRIYGGGGVLLRQSPDGLGNGMVQAGIELISARTYWKGRLRPVAYTDVQLQGRTGWSYGQRFMAGTQFETLRLDGRTIQLLAEYYTGPFPDGQFFTQKTQWVGMGLHFFF